MRIESHLEVDRQEGTVLWCGKILGLVEFGGCTLFAEPEDFKDFEASCVPSAETLQEIKDHLWYGYSLPCRVEPWPGRRGV